MIGERYSAILQDVLARTSGPFELERVHAAHGKKLLDLSLMICYFAVTLFHGEHMPFKWEQNAAGSLIVMQKMMICGYEHKNNFCLIMEYGRTRFPSLDG